MKHGFAFGEHIKTEKVKKRRYDENPHLSFSVRGLLLPVVLIAAVVLLIIKLFILQIFHGNDYRKLADSNRIRTAIIHAPRGIIFDRNGTPLVFNMPGFRQIERDPKNPRLSISPFVMTKSPFSNLSDNTTLSKRIAPSPFALITPRVWVLRV